MNKLILRSLVTASLVLVLLSLPSIASADSILWTLSGVTFSDGGTASGSFVQTAPDVFSSISITTTAGTSFGGATYSTLSGVFPGSSSTTGFIAGAASGDFTGTGLLMLIFDNPLMNTGGTVTDFLTTGDVNGGLEGTCDDATCSSQTEDRFITGGSASSTFGVVTPEPSALSLLVVALGALLAGAAIRKASQA